MPKKINKVIDAGGHPIIELLDETLDKYDEFFWIDQLIGMGFSLVNRKKDDFYTVPIVFRNKTIDGVRNRRDNSKLTGIRRGFGRRLRSMRNSQDLAQSQVAHMASIESVYLSRLELGKQSPSLEIILSLAEALKCKPGDLINDLT